MANDRPDTPASVLVLRFHLEALLGAPRSVTGAQLEQLRQGLGPPGDGAHPDAAARLRIAYMDLLALCRELTELETTAARLRYGPPEVARAGEVYERNVSSADLRRVVLDGGPRGAPPVLLTWEGEERIEAPPGQLAPGRSLVRGQRARWPSYQEIAVRISLRNEPLSARQVQRLLDTALAKVRSALDGRTINEPTDGEPEHGS